MAKSSKAAVNAEFDETLNAAMSDFEKEILAQIENWEKVDIGFPPYWTPEVGKVIIGRVAALDFSDLSFHRVVMQATKATIPCQRGPADGAESVPVAPGEFFTMSEYAGMNLENFMDMEVFIKCSGTRTVPGDKARGLPARDMFEWTVKVSPDDKKRLQLMRADQMKLLANRRTIGGSEVVEQLTA
jgi:hypothetical protein